MTASDLNNFDIVELRNGDRGFVYNEMLIGNNETWDTVSLTCYAEDFTRIFPSSARYLDIVKVKRSGYEPEYIDKIVKKHIEPYTWDWVRTEDYKDVTKSWEWHYCEDENGQDGYVCGKCGEFFPWYYQYYKTPQDFIRRYNFCPGCGAKMKEEKL